MNPLFRLLLERKIQNYASGTLACPKHDHLKLRTRTDMSRQCTVSRQVSIVLCGPEHLSLRTEKDRERERLHTCWTTEGEREMEVGAIVYKKQP